MSYQDVLSHVKALVEEHNNNAGEEAKIDWSKFLKALQAAGGTNEAALALCKFEDLESFGLPKLIARQAAEIFRKSGNTSGQSEKKRIVTDTRARHMTAREALEYYDPRDTDTPVGQRLIELSKSSKCVVFNEDGSVNINATAKLIEEIRDGYPERESYDLNGVPTHIYRIGERPFDYKDENPIYKGRMLRPDGTCDQLNRSWAGVTDKVRQLVYIACHVTGEIPVKSLHDAHEVLDMCLADDSEKKLFGRYSKTALKWREMEEEGSLPKLRIKVGSQQAAKANDPFHGGHKRF